MALKEFKIENCKVRAFREKDSGVVEIHVTSTPKGNMQIVNFSTFDKPEVDIESGQYDLILREREPSSAPATEEKKAEEV